MRTICILAFGMITLSSCFQNYFSVKSRTDWDALDSKDKKVYIHFTQQVREMKNAVVTDSTIRGSLQLPENMRSNYLYPKDPNMNKYKFRDRDMLFSQVHIYVKDSTPILGEFVVNKSNFGGMEVYSPNKGASVGSHILGASLIVVTIGVLVAASAAMTFGPIY